MKFDNKKILVTGGLGSIGSELVKQLLKFKVKLVRIYDNRETECNTSQNNMADDRVRWLIGDIRDKARLKFAMQDVDIVFHASALKHVKQCEYNPFEAIKTNVMGTQNIIECALEYNIDKVINISTDKAVAPISVLGATKLLAEKLITSAENYKGNRKTEFVNVRFGNVIASRGSVYHTFINQLCNLKPLMVTDPKATRFIMTIEEAIKLVLKASTHAKGGETYILRMPVFLLKDLVEMVVVECGSQFFIESADVDINIIGMKYGEKLHESLMTKEESRYVKKTRDYYIITDEIRNKSEIEYSSNVLKPLTKTQLKKYLPI